MKITYFKDGNAVCAVDDTFTNLQESAAGFGDTEAEALVDLISSHVKSNPDCKWLCAHHEWDRAVQKEIKRLEADHDPQP